MRQVRYAIARGLKTEGRRSPRMRARIARIVAEAAPRC
jgi:hypothetical protein